MQAQSPRISPVIPGTEELHILDGMMCPISGTLMTDPVSLEDGHSYERAVILQWLDTHHPGGKCVSPMTGLPLSSNFLMPNHNLRRSIQDLIRRIPSLLLSPKMSNRQCASPSHSQISRFVVPEAGAMPVMVPQSPTSSPMSPGSVYVLSTSLGFFGSGSGLIGTAVETPSFIEGKQKFTNSPKGSSSNSRWVDCMLLIATPTPTHPGHTSRLPIFSFQVTESRTAVSGPTFGCITRNPMQWSAGRKVSCKAATDVLMDNLEALVDDSGYYMDGAGWFKQPSGEAQQVGWFPGKLRKDDIVSLFWSADGRFEVDVNDKFVASANAEFKDANMPAYVWGFVALSGTLKSVRLLEQIWK